MRHRERGQAPRLAIFDKGDELRFARGQADPAMARHKAGIAVTISRQCLDAGGARASKPFWKASASRTTPSPVNSSSKATSWPARSCADPERRRGSLALPGARTVTIPPETTAPGAEKRCACADVCRADFMPHGQKYSGDNAAVTIDKTPLSVVTSASCSVARLRLSGTGDPSLMQRAALCFHRARPLNALPRGRRLPAGLGLDGRSAIMSRARRCWNQSSAWLVLST